MKVSSFMSLMSVLWLGFAFFLQYHGEPVWQVAAATSLNQFWLIGAFITGELEDDDEGSS